MRYFIPENNDYVESDNDYVESDNDDSYSFFGTSQNIIQKRKRILSPPRSERRKLISRNICRSNISWCKNIKNKTFEYFENLFDSLTLTYYLFFNR